MANREHLEILKQGVEVWNRWRKENPGTQPDLAKVDLIDETLTNVNFRRTNLTNANLGRAYLVEANLTEAFCIETNFGMADLYGTTLNRADLTKANLSEANLCMTDLTGANLVKTDLRKANLSAANLSNADLTGADLTGAYLASIDLGKTNLNKSKMGWTILADVDLSVVTGLETVVHTGPSEISIGTIYRSNGNIPQVFLRGAGVPDTFITYIASLTGKAIQYYSCFISYSGKDETFVQRLHADLQQKGVRCWFAPEDMKIGDKIRPRIDESIRIHDKLLLVLSESSINSTWVEKEVETAFEEEGKRNQIVLFPVRLDEAVMETHQAWAADIRRTRHIGDFTQWKDHDAYHQAFERLLRDLKPED